MGRTILVDESDDGHRSVFFGLGQATLHLPMLPARENPSGSGSNVGGFGGSSALTSELEGPPAEGSGPRAP